MSMINEKHVLNTQTNVSLKKINLKHSCRNKPYTNAVHQFSWDISLTTVAAVRVVLALVFELAELPRVGPVAGAGGATGAAVPGAGLSVVL